MNAIDPFSLEKTLSKIIQGQSDLETAQQAQQELLQPVNTNLLNEGQGFKGLWSNPTDNQRQGILQTGLSLLSTHDTNNLSQRIGQAIGQGMSSIQEGRQLDQKRQLSQSGLDIQRLQGRQQHNQAMAGIGIQLNQQQIEEANRLAKIEAEKNQSLATGNIIFSDGTKSGFQRRGDRLTDLSGKEFPAEKLVGATIERVGRTPQDVLPKDRTQAGQTLSETSLATSLGVDVVFAPNLDKLVGPIQNRVIPRALTDIAGDPADRVLNDRIDKFNFKLLPAALAPFAPITEAEIEVAFEGVGLNKSLNAPELRSVFATTQMPSLLTTIEHNADTKRGGTGSYARAEVATIAAKDALKQGMPASELSGFLANVTSKWMPNASPELSGKGYYVTNGGKIITPEFIKVYASVKNIAPEVLIQKMQLREY